MFFEVSRTQDEIYLVIGDERTQSIETHFVLNDVELSDLIGRLHEVENHRRINLLK
jgi:hypothetical protein